MDVYYKSGVLDFYCEECDQDVEVPLNKCSKVKYKMLDPKDSFDGWKTNCPGCKARLSTEEQPERGKMANPQRKATKRILGTNIRVIDHPPHYYYIPPDLKAKLEEEKRLREEIERERTGGGGGNGE